MTVLPQLRLFEVEDQRWLPAPVRDAITGYLSWLGNLSPEPYRLFAAALARAMAETEDRRLVDLCAGASGPWARLMPLLEEHGHKPQVTMTDLYPNVPALTQVAARSGGRIEFVQDPVDATAVPPGLTGFRVIFNAFHHFPPATARRILADACAQGRGIAIFEGVERTVPSVLTCLSSLLLVLLATPFIRPVSSKQLLLTYALPIVPVCAAWDGIASSFRCYAIDQLLDMAWEVAPDYHWEAARCPVPYSPLASTYLIGRPTANPARLSLAPRN